MSKGIIRNVIMVIVFIVCLALIIIGQKNISAAGLGMELIGLVGLLTLLFIYNHRFKYEYKKKELLLNRDTLNQRVICEAMAPFYFIFDGFGRPWL